MGIQPGEVRFASGSFCTADGRDVHNFCVVAQGLQKEGVSRFVPRVISNELGVTERARIATSGLCAWYQVFDGIDQPDF